MKTFPSKKHAAEKDFGYVFCLVFLLIAFLPLFNGHSMRLWAFQVASFFFVVAIVFPVLLKYPCLFWSKVGLLLHHIVNPLILGIIYFGVVCPIGAIMRRVKGGLMKINFNSSAKSYWIERDPAGPNPKTMSQQF